MVAGETTKVDYMVRVALTCKYMGWDYQTYMSQPSELIYIIDTLRIEEVKEHNRRNNGK